VKRVAAAFAGYRALAVTDDVIGKYVEQRQRDGAAPATINRELEVIGRAFALAKRKLRFTPSIPSLPERNARQGFFDRADFERVLSYIDDADVVDFLEWFYLTGMRPNEIRSLTWATYDRETSMLTLPSKDAKTGQPRTLPMRAKLRPIIERRVKARRIHHDDGRESLAEYIFHRGGQRIGEFRKTWVTACEKAGLADVQGEGRTRKVRPLKLVYDLRRTAIRNAVRAGVDPAVVMRISGHRTRAVFDRYNIIDERDLAAAIERTSAYVETLPTSSNVVSLRTEAGRRP
jgi:integrase